MTLILLRLHCVIKCNTEFIRQMKDITEETQFTENDEQNKDTHTIQNPDTHIMHVIQQKHKA